MAKVQTNICTKNSNNLRAPQMKMCGLEAKQVQEFEGATRLGATRPPALRRKWHSERVSERAFEKPLKTSENLSNPLKTSQNL